VFKPVVLESLERILLIVGCKFKSEGKEREDGKYIIRNFEGGVRLKDRRVSWNPEEEENDVLSDG